MPETYSKYAAMMKAAIIEENRRKAQRRREEKLFVKSIDQNYHLSHLSAIRAELEAKRAPPNNESGFPSRPQTPSPPREEPIRCVGAFDAAVRCLEPTHGGASLWTGEGDGTIGIRNGVNGDFAYRIDASVDDAGVPVLVDVLYASGNNMFVGYADGHIRVYDLLVFVLAMEAKAHTKSVCGFVTTFDQRTFSASTDGSVVKWDTEGNDFTKIASAQQNHVLRCIATYGYHLFAGTEQGTVVAFDSDTLEVTHSYEGHQGAVNCVAVQDGYLFSGGSDNAVMVWNIATAEALKTLQGHAAPVSSFHCDTVAHQIWSSDLIGCMNVWSTIDERDFAFVRSCAHDSETEVFAIRGITVIDAVKVWSLGSNGVNKVWHASANRVEEGIRGALGTMQTIIEQDDVELKKWDGLTRTLKEMACRVDQQMSEAMREQNSMVLQLQSYFIWQRFVARRKVLRLQRLVAGIMEQRVMEDRRREFLQYWLSLCEQRERLKRQTAIARLMRSQHNERLVVCYAKKLFDYGAICSRRERAQRRCVILGNITARRMQREVFAAWQQKRFDGQTKRKRELMAEALASLAARRLLCRAYCDWRTMAAARERKLLVQRCVATGGNACDRGLMRSSWHRWLRFQRACRTKKQSVATLKALALNHGRLRMSAAFRKWMMFSSERVASSLDQQSAANKEKIVALQRVVKSMDHLLQRRSLLDEADAMIQRALLQREAKKATSLKLQADIEELACELERKKNHQPVAVEKTLQEQVADLISLLKCKLLNFFADFPQIQRVAEKTRRLGAPKVFLEAHQAVKRVVVEMTKEGYLAADKEWPLTDKMIRQMKSHHTEVVLGAIKTMIMAYDALDVAQRASLVSDEEIVVNAHNLHLLADRCVAARALRNQRK